MKNEKVRAFQISRYLLYTILLTSFTAKAGPIGADSRLIPEPLYHTVNTFSPNGKDPLVRVSKRTGLKEFAAIGKIRTLQPVPWSDGNGGLMQARAIEGTGFLISPCLVMTTYHSVFGLSKTPNSTDFSISFTANRTVIGTPLVWRRHEVGVIAKDWTIVKLEDKDCLGAEVGFLKMLEPEELFDKQKSPTIFTAGYPGKKDGETGPGQLWAHLKCTVFEGFYGGIYASTIFNDCATSSGQSGSPLLVRNSAGEIRYVGMQVVERGSEDKIYRKFNLENANVGVDLISALTLQDLDLIEADIASHGRVKPPNPPR